MKRVFHFSYDERVYLSDMIEIHTAILAFPKARIFIHEPSWNGECQTFVLAESAIEAKQIYLDYYGKDMDKQSIN